MTVEKVAIVITEHVGKDAPVQALRGVRED